MKHHFPVYDINQVSAAQKTDLHISKLDHYMGVNKMLNCPHKNNFYQVLLCTKGTGSLDIDFQSYPITPNQICFMVPGQVYKLDFEQEAEGFVINFSVPFFKLFFLRPDYLEQFPYFSGMTENSIINLPDSIQPDIHQIFEKITHEGTAGNRLSHDMVKVLLVQFFILISRLELNVPSLKMESYNHTLLKKFHQLIECNLGKLNLPREYAELLFITPSHLNALCNKMLGKSTGEVIRDRIILEAKRLLINMELSVAQVSFMLNFSDNAYFSKFFRKHTGIAPQEFRYSQMKAESA
jgi:AraC family transcriptional activator of pobA